jgi:hypothetical protein
MRPMSAKPAKKNGPKPMPPTPVQPAATPVPATVGAGSASPAAAQPNTSFVPWIESADPKKRMIGKIVLVAAWIYVAALWLLALDQTFHWGIFGPKVPPVP